MVLICKGAGGRRSRRRKGAKAQREEAGEGSPLTNKLRAFAPSRLRDLSVLLLAAAEDCELEVAQLAGRGVLDEVELARVLGGRAAHQLARLVQLARLGALQLAARRLGQRPGGQRDDVVEGEAHAF